MPIKYEKFSKICFKYGKTIHGSIVCKFGMERNKIGMDNDKQFG